MGFRKEEMAAFGERTGEVKKVLWAVLFLNLAVAAAKIIYGTAINSVSMQADGFHSTFDGTSNAIGLIGMVLASRPADRDHPYGHSKYETFASAVIGIMLLFASWEIGSKAIARIMNGGAPPDIGAGSFLVMGLTLMVNIFVAGYETRKGRDLKSDILTADASHTSSDIIVSVGVLVGLGLVKMGIPAADPVIALAVACVIAWTAWGVFKRANDIFSDRARLETGKVCGVVLKVPGVLGCHGIRTRGMASHIHVDLHIQVDPEKTVAQGHKIAENVERAVCEGIEGVVDVIVHLEPMDEYQKNKTLHENDNT